MKATALVILMSVSSILAQVNTPKSSFSFDCADKATLQAAHLEAVAKAALKHLGQHAIDWADRAVVAAPEGGGGAAEQWFVPLSCSGTCNCEWAVFRGSPPKDAGRINACVVGIESTPSGPARILAYGHMSAGDGVMLTYELRDGKYKETSRSDVDWEAASKSLHCESRNACCEER